MVVQFTLIRLGKRLKTQIIEYDGPEAANLKQIEDVQMTGMDPGELLRNGKDADWIEARILK